MDKDVPRVRRRSSIITMVQDLARKHQKDSVAFHIRPSTIKRRKIGHLDTKLKGKVMFLSTKLTEVRLLFL